MVCSKTRTHTARAGSSSQRHAIDPEGLHLDEAHGLGASRCFPGMAIWKGTLVLRGQAPTSECSIILEHFRDMGR
jgi:hypothetical protein